MDGSPFGKSSGEDIGLRDGNDSDLGNFGGDGLSRDCARLICTIDVGGDEVGVFLLVDGGCGGCGGGNGGCKNCGGCSESEGAF